MALIVGQLLLLAAGEIPAPDVEIAAALAQVKEGISLVAPDRIGGRHPIFGQLLVLLAIKQPETGHRERVLMLAKGLIRRGHLVDEPLPVGTGQGRRQRQIGLQGAAGDRGPVELAPLVAFRDKMVGIGRAQALAAQQQSFAIGAEGLRQIGARIASEAHHLAAVGGYHEHIFVAVEIGGKGELFAIRRPDWPLAQVVAAGERRSGATLGTGDKNAPLPGEGKLLAIGGEGGLAQPECIGGDTGGQPEQEWREQQGGEAARRAHGMILSGSGVLSSPIIAPGASAIIFCILLF